MKQKTKTSSLLAIALIAGLGSLGTATAATVIAGIGVDIGSGGTFAGTGVLGESFITVQVGPTTNSNTSSITTTTNIGTNGAGNVTLAFTASAIGAGAYAGAVDQNGTGSPNLLFRDSVAAGTNTGTGATITFTIAGLTPNELYRLVAYAGSSDGGDSTLFTGALSGTVNPVPETASRSVFEAGGNYLLNPSVAADGNGEIIFTAAPGAGNGFAVVNGIGIQAVPEPSSAALLLGGLGMVVLRRRRA